MVLLANEKAEAAGGRRGRGRSVGRVRSRFWELEVKAFQRQHDRVRPSDPFGQLDQGLGPAHWDGRADWVVAQIRAGLIPGRARLDRWSERAENAQL